MACALTACATAGQGGLAKRATYECVPMNAVVVEYAGTERASASRGSRARTAQFQNVREIHPDTSAAVEESASAANASASEIIPDHTSMYLSLLGLHATYRFASMKNVEVTEDATKAQASVSAILGTTDSPAIQRHALRAAMAMVSAQSTAFVSATRDTRATGVKNEHAHMTSTRRRIARAVARMELV